MFTLISDASKPLVNPATILNKRNAVVVVAITAAIWAVLLIPNRFRAVSVRTAIDAIYEPGNIYVWTIRAIAAMDAILPNIKANPARKLNPLGKYSREYEYTPPALDTLLAS
jgi:hypothetical protein